MTYALILFPTSPGLQCSILGGFTSESDANDSGDAAILDAYFDHYLVIPAPPQTASLNVNQNPGGGGVGPGGGGGGGQQQ